MKILVRRKPDGTWQAIARRPDGRPVAVSVREKDMADEIARRVAARMPPGASSAGIWSGIKKIAHKVARARVIRKAAAAVQEVAGNPIVAHAVGLGLQVYGVPAPVTEAVLDGIAKGRIDENTLLAGLGGAAAGGPGMGMTLAAIASDAKFRANVPALAKHIGRARKGNRAALATVAAAAKAAATVRASKGAMRELLARAEAGDADACARLVIVRQAYQHVRALHAARCAPAGASPHVAPGGAVAGAKAWRGHGDMTWTAPGGRQWHGDVHLAVGALGPPRIGIAYMGGRL